MLINAAIRINPFILLPSNYNGELWASAGTWLLQPKHIELMGHVIFAWTIVLVGRIQTEVCNLAAVEACKSLDLWKQNTKPCVNYTTFLPVLLNPKCGNRSEPDEQIGNFGNQSS
jgi:hypothetical protein